MFRSKRNIVTYVIGALYGVSIALYLMIGSEQDSSLFNFMTWITSGIIMGCITSHGIYTLSLFLDQKLPWKEHIGLRLFAGIVSSFLVLYLLSSIVLYNVNLFMSPEATIAEFFQSGPTIKLAVLILMLTIIANILYLAFYSYNSYSKETISAVISEREQIDLQINALKSQLSPHFLFNNLNTISSLIHKDQTRAEKFIRKMAQSYQYILNSYDTTLVTLKQELDFVESSMHLLQTRFKNTGQLDIQLTPEELEIKVPTLTIQMLVENAIKHNVSTQDNPVLINIHSDGKNIFVSNNKTESPKNVISTKVGLSNIANRYKLLGHDEIEIHDNSIFSVKLPFIK